MSKIVINLQTLMNGSTLLRSMPEDMRKKVEGRILALSPEKKKKAALIFLKEKKQIQGLERAQRKTVLVSFSDALTEVKNTFFQKIKTKTAEIEKTEKKKAIKKSLSRLKNA